MENMESFGRQARWIPWICLAFLGQAQPTEPVPDFSAVVSQIQARLAAGVPSIAVAVTWHGRIIWEYAAGMADQQRNISASVHTPYYLASISKTVTATALMKLVEQKKVDLDQPVNRYLKTAKVSSPMWDVAKATVRRVGNHTAGLATYDRDCLADDPQCDASAAGAIRRYGVIVWPPGAYFDYSNMDYGILGEAVAGFSGGSLDRALRSTVFAPLGMANCLLDSTTDTANPPAARYDQSPPFARTPSKRSTSPGASSVYCSAHDLAMFGMFHLKDHLSSQRGILSDHSIELMQSPSLDPGEESQYGLSWWVQNDLNGFHGVLAQGGTNDATAYLQLIPSEDIAVAMLWNTGTPEGSKLIDQILAAVLPQYRENLVHPAATPQPAPTAVAPKVPAGMVGTWSGSVQTYLRKVPLTVTIDASGGLIARLGSGPDVRRANPRYGDGVIRWTMPGALGVEGEPFDLAMRLYLYKDTLAGAARTAPPPSSRNPTWVYYWVRVDRRQDVGSR
jgi:CubicO group peptidase (beta-lactamase class C family)